MTGDERLHGAPSPTEFDQLVERLNTVSQRLAALDETGSSTALAGDGATAAENRSIRGAHAHLARADTRSLRIEVGEVRRRAQEMARTARRAQQQAQRMGPPPLDADQVPVAALTRLCGHALRVAASVSWAQIAVPVRDGTTATAASGDVPTPLAEAVARGPRATAGRSGVPVVVDDVAVDTRWPALREGDTPPASLLVLPLGVTGGALTLAADVVGAFDGANRAVAGELARHAGRVVAARIDGRSGGPTDPAVQAYDAVVAARALLARHRRLAADAAFDALLARSAATGETILSCAQQVVDELGGQIPDEDGPPEPATLRRAVAYLEAHATEDVDVEAVAAAAGVGVRGLQMTFRRWRDNTPLGHLREIRLERAHEELTTADARKTSVAEVAARWRFTHPGRFSVTYRQRYGCSPSETLRA